MAGNPIEKRKSLLQERLLANRARWQRDQGEQSERDERAGEEGQGRVVRNLPQSQRPCLSKAVQQDGKE